MRRKLTSPAGLLRLLLSAMLLLSGLIWWRLFAHAQAAGTLFTAPKWPLTLGLLGALILVQLGLLLATLRDAPRVWRWLWAAGTGLRRLGRANYLLLAALQLACGWAVLGEFGYLFLGLAQRLALLTLVTLASTILLWAAGVRRSPGELLAAGLLVSAASLRALGFLTDISTSPLSHYWSEASRFYYASLFLSERVYGLTVPPSVLHPSRYLMQAVPFLIPQASIWLHRAWQAALWDGVTLACALTFARALGGDRFRRLLVTAWTFIFLLVGPVYYHLQIPLILIFWALGRKGTARRFGPTLAVVIAASAWTGISRVNWFPVPALLAATFLYLEEPVGRTDWLHTLKTFILKPLGWGIVGVAAAFAAQTLYARWSGNPSDQFTSSLSSDLLWYRLWPNPTFPLGVLPAALLFSAPLLAIFPLRLRWRDLHPLRWLGLAGMLGVLLAGGLVVSVKIGGGSNLHNLDAYLSLLMLMAGMVYFGRVTREGDDPERLPPARPLWLERLALTAALLLPVYFTLEAVAPQPLPTAEQVARVLSTLDEMTADLAPGDEVLFIAERQLVTFHYVDVRLVPEYERVFLMEMVMAGNQPYLDQFHADLRNQRFKLIVSEPLYLQMKGASASFGEENDLWVRQVSRPVLCSYRPRNLLADLHIQLLQPRAGERSCP